MKNKAWGSRIFDVVNIFLLLVVTAITIIPLLHVFMGSFATAEEMARKPFILIPTQFSLNAYNYIFTTNTLFSAMGVSIGITLAGTLVSMFLTCLMAYGLTRRDLDGRKVINFLIVFTMLFQGGMIPTFFVVKSLHLVDSYMSLIFPVAISAFNLIIMRSFFQNLPDGLEESAKIDGCNDFGILFRIVLPLSLPAIATISLFYAVTYWNTYFNAVLYINNPDKWPIQVILRQIVILASGFTPDTSSMGSDYVRPPEQSVKMAVIVVSTLPILLVYPFLQKYFAKGALVGSVKG
jgi:putative aldouronate transport system permease protein